MFMRDMEQDRRDHPENYGIDFLRNLEHGMKSGEQSPTCVDAKTTETEQQILDHLPKEE